ncbi:MAG: hypothetical protein KDJ65_21125, partial [Anaerolineae bacterium]|nr:hypothetical protein [Anaerolineae bacterium]
WVSIQFSLSGATLSIFDDAPDADTRVCLASYPFPLSETVHPRTITLQPDHLDQSQEHCLIQLPFEFFASSFHSTTKLVTDFLAMY